MLKEQFIAGGYQFMSVLTILLIITTAWIIYQFVIGYNSKQPNQEKILRMIGYGKSMGLFALVTGFLGQMVGLIGMFDAIRAATQNAEDIKPELVYSAIGVTMISATYGILIFLFSMILWFIASFIIEKKTQN